MIDPFNAVVKFPSFEVELLFSKGKSPMKTWAGELTSKHHFPFRNTNALHEVNDFSGNPSKADP